MESSLEIQWWDDPIDRVRKFKVTGTPHAEEIEKRISDHFQEMVKKGRFPKTARQAQIEEKMLIADLEADGLVPEGTAATWGEPEAEEDQP